MINNLPVTCLVALGYDNYCRRVWLKDRNTELSHPLQGRRDKGESDPSGTFLSWSPMPFTDPKRSLKVSSHFAKPAVSLDCSMGRVAHKRCLPNRKDPAVEMGRSVSTRRACSTTLQKQIRDSHQPDHTSRALHSHMAHGTSRKNFRIEWH